VWRKGRLFGAVSNTGCLAGSALELLFEPAVPGQVEGWRPQQQRVRLGTKLCASFWRAANRSIRRSSAPATSVEEKDGAGPPAAMPRRSEDVRAEGSSVHLTIGLELRLWSFRRDRRLRRRLAAGQRQEKSGGEQCCYRIQGRAVRRHHGVHSSSQGRLQASRSVTPPR
jgi:hypothetical protein